MFSLRFASQGTLRTFKFIPTPPRQGNWPCLVRSHLTRQLETKLLQRRCYAQASKPNPKPARAAEEELKRQAKAAAAGTKHFEIPERLLIYHAGTGRITFLAMVKVTTLFLGAFFTFLVVPGYVKADKPEWETAGVALCGIIPLLFVAYTTSPFVTHIHIHLPPAARASRPVLERFVNGTLPPSTELTLTTMSAIAKPRYSTMQAGHLRPTRQRFGIINYVRGGDGAAIENESRKWYNFRAATKFCVQDVKPEKKGKAKAKKSKALTETWIWDSIKEKISKREAAAAKSS